MEKIGAHLDGWTLRGVYDDPKLTELADTYRDIGFLVRVESVIPGSLPGCTTCIDSSPDRYRVLYTKKIDS